jgi:hypothetical protein
VVDFSARFVFVTPGAVARFFGLASSVPGDLVMGRVMGRPRVVLGGTAVSGRDSATRRHDSYRQDSDQRDQTLDHGSLLSLISRNAVTLGNVR